MKVDCSPKHIPIAAGLLVVYWVALPLPLPRSSTQLSNERCLSLADNAPQPDQPLALLEQCSAQLPNDVELLADLGGEYERAGQWHSAEAAYLRALTIDPQYADVRRRLAVLMLRRGARDDARRQIEAALQVQPNRKVLLDLLAETGGTNLHP